MKRLKELEKENARLQGPGRRAEPRQGDPQGGRPGKLVSPARRRQAVAQVMTAFKHLRAPGLPSPGRAPVESAVPRDRTRTRGGVVVADQGVGPGAPPLRLPADP